MRSSSLIYFLIALLVFIPASKNNLKNKKEIFSQKDFEKNNQAWFDVVKKKIKQKELEFHTTERKNFAYETVNRTSNLRVYVNQNEMLVKSREIKNDWEVKYQLLNLERKDKFDIPNLKTELNGTELKLSSKDFSIQYLNSRFGIRQNFIVNKKLEGEGALKLNLKVETPFKMVIGKNTIIHKKNKKEVLNYQDLKVFDVTGKILAAHFEKNKNLVSIVVDDKNAKYPITIDPLNTTPSWTNEQNQANAYLGYSIAYVGDTNNDGYGDVLVGAPFFDNGQTDEGKVFLFRGSATGLAATASWTYECNIANCQLGYSVAAAGNVNNDLYQDIIIGAPFYTSGQTAEGAAFIFHGSATGPAATPNRTLQSNQANAHFGYSVAGGAKLNNDAFGDVIIGAPHYDNPTLDEGIVFVYVGSSTGIGATATYTMESNQAQSSYGEAVAVVGDANGDGYSEIAVGAPLYDNGQTDEGRVYVYSGSATGLNTTASTILEYNKADAYFGSTLAGGNINKDGYYDLAVGAPHWSGPSDVPYAAGAVLVYHGSSTGLATTPTTSYFGTNDWDYLGGGLALGDLNGDSMADLAIGSPLYSTSLNEGKIEVYFGTVTGLKTTVGWSKVGAGSEATLGQAIAIGDVNKDLAGDLITSGVYETNGQTYEGKLYVYNGIQTGLSTTATASFTYATQASSKFGFSMGSAGDVNNDGYDDLLVGSYMYDNGQTNEGRAYLFNGSATGLSTTPSWTFENNQATAYLGFSVSTAGDVNNDGYADVIIGSYLFDKGQTDEGVAYIFHGSATGLPATENTLLEINRASSRFAYSVASAGDVNGDGYSDVAVGAPRHLLTVSNEGALYVYKGSATGINTTPILTYGSGQATAYLGWSVSSAGDVNNDGYADVIAGAPMYDTTATNAGRVYLFNGSSTGISSTPNWTYSANKASAQIGYSVSYAGKLNNDNYGDVVIGAPFHTNTAASEGAAYVFYGSATGLGASPNWTKYIAQASANYGKVVGSAGDVDGDGYKDVAIAAALYDNGQTNEGAVFIYQGSSLGLSATHLWRGEPNTASVLYGTSIAGDLDINGDGYGDFVVGAPDQTTTNTKDGKIYVYYGNPI